MMGVMGGGHSLGPAGGIVWQGALQATALLGQEGQCPVCSASTGRAANCTLLGGTLKKKFSRPPNHWWQPCLEGPGGLLGQPKVGPRKPEACYQYG